MRSSGLSSLQNSFPVYHLSFDSEDDRCLRVAHPYDIRYKCQLNLSIREQSLLPAMDVFSAEWDRKRPSQVGAAGVLPKMTHDSIYSS